MGRGYNGAMPLQLPPVVAALSARLSQIGFERTRRALAGLALSVFVTIYLLVALQAPEGFTRVFLALALCYGVAFVAVVAEWFWGRWFASGLAWSGIMIAIAALYLVGWAPQLAIFGALHGVVVLALMGKKMAARYDMQEAWRERYKMDEFGVARLQKTVTRSAASLPSLIFWALAPKEEGLAALGALAVLALAAVGLRGLIRLRSWGVLAVAGAGVGAAASVIFNPAPASVVGTHAYGLMAGFVSGGVPLAGFASGGVPVLALVFLAAALVPFVGPVARYLRRSA
jgi:hypothetical protein